MGNYQFMKTNQKTEKSYQKGLVRGIKTFPKKNKKRRYGRKKYNKLPKIAKEKIQKKLL